MSSSGRHLLGLIESVTKFISFGSSKAVQSTPQQQAQAALAASKLDVVLSKVQRAKAVLEQLQVLEGQEAKLLAKYEPLLAQLQRTREQLEPEQLEKAATFALSEGLRGSLQRATGRPTPSSAAEQDPFGIIVALSPRHSQAPMTWRGYVAQLRNLSEHTVLRGPALDEVLAFNNERRRLAAEMTALQRSLGGQVELPSLGPLQHEVAQLDAFVQSVVFAQRAHQEMLRRDVARLDLTALQLRLQAALGVRYEGSEATQLLERLRPVHALCSDGKVPPVAELEQFEADLRRLGEVLAAQRPGSRSSVPTVQEQRYQKLVFDRVAQQQPDASDV